MILPAPCSLRSRRLPWDRSRTGVIARAQKGRPKRLTIRPPNIKSKSGNACAYAVLLSRRHAQASTPACQRSLIPVRERQLLPFQIRPIGAAIAIEISLHRMDRSPHQLGQIVSREVPVAAALGQPAVEGCRRQPSRIVRSSRRRRLRRWPRCGRCRGSLFGHGAQSRWLRGLWPASLSNPSGSAA